MSALRDASVQVLADASATSSSDASPPAPSDASAEYFSDASTSPAAHASVHGSDACAWCQADLPPRRRGGTRPGERRFCSQRHRQAHAKFRADVALLAAAGAPKRLAVADPPYPDKAYLYRGHPDYAGEVDHRELLVRLDRDYDGWALATSADALPWLLAMASCELGIAVRVAAWFRGHRPGKAGRPRSAWEAVLYRPARPGVVGDQVEDALVFHAGVRRSDPRRVIGAKPATWSSWVFGLLQARAGDDLDDLFPGSGGVRRAWDLAASSAAPVDASERTWTDASD